jgi:GT2 family glycosyltransferase
MDGRSTAGTSNFFGQCDDAGSTFAESSPPTINPERPRVAGKFFFVGDEKLWVRGASYGPFRPHDGSEYGAPSAVEADFKQMAANGLNTIRTYTVPPTWLLDLAYTQKLRVMVGLPWEQHVTFLDDRDRVQSIIERVRTGVRACEKHPAVFCYVVGNEIPASIVRWHGPSSVERFIRRLRDTVREEDPQALVTYVNFPTTEYLDLGFLDFLAFNVYLESEERLRSYIGRLQNIANNKPLLLAEVGLDSRRNGQNKQAATLAWQIRSAFEIGCAGLIIFSWTDEWHRGGFDIEDWDFGLTTRARKSKPALSAVSSAFADAPFAHRSDWPSISVVICSYNGAKTIGQTLAAVTGMKYPRFETLVIDDGSEDDTAKIAAQYPVKLISTVNRGLSDARNMGWKVAKGEIVAYIDDDAYPDRDWLFYLATLFQDGNYVAVGGPNIVPENDNFVAQCVALSPGNPVHVLLTDVLAEHGPGCNMAIRRAALAELGGFDSRFRIAGDDVDLCWRIQDKGWLIGFSSAAMVWHHRRPSLPAYWRQQLNYGRAERLLEEKWPQKYSDAGHVGWNGRLYGDAAKGPLGLRRRRVFYGKGGTALFQSVYEHNPAGLITLPSRPEWYVVIGLLAAATAIDLLQPIFFFSAPLLVLSLIVPLIPAFLNARRALLLDGPDLNRMRWRALLFITLLHVLQPLARLMGRVRSVGQQQPAVPRVFRPWCRETIWSEFWSGTDERLNAIAVRLRHAGLRVRFGDEFARHDLQICRGRFAGARMLMAIEEHGAGRQLIRLRIWPYLLLPARAVLAISFGGMAITAAVGNFPLSIGFAILAVMAMACAFEQSAAACSIVRKTLLEDGDETVPLVPTQYDEQALTVASDESNDASRKFYQRN